MNPFDRSCASIRIKEVPPDEVEEDDLDCDPDQAYDDSRDD
jgi:hypothetical protein